MTLGLSLGCSLGIGNSILPDWSEITRLWTPHDRTNMLWFDASDSLVALGSDIIEFKEKLGGASLTGTGGTTSRNSLQALNISGPAFSGPTSITALPQTWFIAFKPNSHDSSGDKVFSYSEGASPQLRLRAGNGTNFLGRFEKLNGVPGQDVYPGFLTDTNSSGITDWAIASIRLDFVAGFLQDRYNGCPAEGDHVDYNTLQENANLILGGSMDVDIAEILVINSVDELQVQTVEGYLAHKWAMTLCSANPFSSGPPTVTTVGETRYLTDEDGNYITDANGAQVVIQG